MKLELEYTILKDLAQALIRHIEQLENVTPEDNILKYTYRINEDIQEINAFYSANIEPKI